MQQGGFLFLAVVVVLGPYAEGQPTANAEQACGSYWGAKAVQGSSGNISSPGYPGPYPSNADCAWRIMVEEGKRIVIVFKALGIEHHEACSYDYLQIRDGAETTAASLAKVCGHTLPPSVTSSGNNVLIRFRSDASVGGEGFDIEWSAECLPSLISRGSTCIDQSKQACGREDGSVMAVQGSSGKISSPGYPNRYPANSHCAWRIMVDEGQRIVIVFKALDIEDNPVCAYDYLLIVEDAETTAAFLAKVCGHTLPPSVTSSGNNVVIIFRSDRAVHTVGFYLEWSAECLPGLISCGDSSIDQSKKGNLTIDWEDEDEEWAHDASLMNAEPRGDLHCNSTSMSVTFSRDELSGPNVTSLRLRDPSCTAVLNNTHVTFSTALDECGTTAQENGTSNKIIFTNEITTGVDSDRIISRSGAVRWTFSCHYVRDDTVSTGPLFPVPAPSVIIINGEGTFTFRMELYRTDGFLQPYSQGDFPVEVGVNDQVYFGITAEASISGLVLFVENCKATPTSNKEDPTQYYIIQDGCETDDTLREYPSEESTSAQFGFSAFKFNNNPQPYVYLHCDVMVCLENNGGSRCDKGCVGARRRRRAAAGAGIEGRTSLVQGPIVLVQDSDTNGALNIWIAVVASVAVGLAVVVMATVGCLWLCKRQKPRKDVEGHNNFVCTLKRGGKVGPANSAPY